jgi:hypothetical protein
MQSVTVLRAYLVLAPKLLGNRIRRFKCILTFRTDDDFLFYVKNETKRCQFLTELLTWQPLPAMDSWSGKRTLCGTGLLDNVIRVKMLRW